MSCWLRWLPEVKRLMCLEGCTLHFLVNFIILVSLSSSIAKVSMLADFILVKSIESSPPGFDTEGNGSHGIDFLHLLT